MEIQYWEHLDKFRRIHLQLIVIHYIIIYLIFIIMLVFIVMF